MAMLAMSVFVELRMWFTVNTMYITTALPINASIKLVTAIIVIAIVMFGGMVGIENPPPSAVEFSVVLESAESSVKEEKRTKQKAC